MRVIGLTGSIGAGKSTVGRWAVEHGAVLLDSDQLVRELYATDAALQGQLRARFGEHVVADGQVDRRALGAIVFSDPGALADLEALTHPAVRRLRDEKLAGLRRDGIAVSLVEAVKLVESGGSEVCDELWIVVAEAAVQLARLAGRGVDEAEARRRLARQGTVTSWTAAFLAESRRLGRARPVAIVDNSGSEAEGRAQVARLWQGLTAPPAAPLGGAP